MVITAKLPPDSDEGACITSYDLAVLDPSGGARLAGASFPTPHALEDSTSFALPRDSPAAALLAGGRTVTLEITPRSDVP